MLKVLIRCSCMNVHHPLCASQRYVYIYACNCNDFYDLVTFHHQLILLLKLQNISSMQFHIFSSRNE